MPPFSTAVTRLLDYQAASERALVLHALGIDSAIVELEGRHVVAVAAEDGPRARAEIDKFDRENPPAPLSPREASPPMSWGIAAAAVYAAVLAIFWRTGSYEAGRADAALIRGGAWWRTVTALTLHADLPH